jgi:hypothetical protein
MAVSKLLAGVLAGALVLAAAPSPPDACAAGLGLGVIAGEPTGVSLKVWLDGHHAIDAAAGWSFADNARLHLHADYLWHDFGVLRAAGASGRLPVYFGVGGRLMLRNDEGGQHHDDLLGVRIPLGISWIPATAPLDLFAEIAPVLDLVPETDLHVNAAVGVRFWFR